jgi:hypothetical protein
LSFDGFKNYFIIKEIWNNSTFKNAKIFLEIPFFQFIVDKKCLMVKVRKELEIQILF